MGAAWKAGVLGLLLLVVGGAGHGLRAQPTVREAMPPPPGYTAVEYPADSFSGFVQRLPLKADTTILGHDGRAVEAPYFHVLRVVDLPLLFSADLEQCADQCMRFWAEYHRARNGLNALYLFEYGGKRMYFRERKQSLRAFLRRAFAYSNSHSLKKGCRVVPPDQVRPGDMIVQNDTGGIGHVSMVVHMCRSAGGEPLYLIGFAFIPAQQFHIERAPEGYGTAGWFTLEGFFRYLHDAFDFGRPVLRRFE